MSSRVDASPGNVVIHLSRALTNAIGTPRPCGFPNSIGIINSYSSRKAEGETTTGKKQRKNTSPLIIVLRIVLTFFRVFFLLFPVKTLLDRRTAR